LEPAELDCVVEPREIRRALHHIWQGLLEFTNAKREFQCMVRSLNSSPEFASIHKDLIKELRTMNIAMRSWVAVSNNPDYSCSLETLYHQAVAMEKHTRCFCYAMLRKDGWPTPLREEPFNWGYLLPALEPLSAAAAGHNVVLPFTSLQRSIVTVAWLRWLCSTLATLLGQHPAACQFSAQYVKIAYSVYDAELRHE